MTKRTRKGQRTGCGVCGGVIEFDGRSWFHFNASVHPVSAPQDHDAMPEGARTRLITDTERLDWLDARRVIVMRCRDPRHNDAWKVETMAGPFIRDSLRDAIDLAMEMSGQPRKDGR